MGRMRVDGGGGGLFKKWSDMAEGTVIAGTFLGLHEGKFGPLLDLESDEGRLTLPVPAVLHRQLTRIRVGAAVTIEYGGMRHNEKTGRDYHNFATFLRRDHPQAAAPRHLPQRAGPDRRHSQLRPRTHNKDPRPFIWTATASAILRKIKRCKDALETGH
jgi:hypothetical protein